MSRERSEGEMFRRRGDAYMEAIDILIAEPDGERADRIRAALAPTLNSVEVFCDAESTADRLLRRGDYSRERRHPELVIIDAEMIGDDCWKVIKRFREQEHGKRAVVVVLAAEPDVRMAERAMEAGASWFKRRPLDLGTLAEILEDVEQLGLAVVSWPAWLDEERQEKEGEGVPT